MKLHMKLPIGLVCAVLFLTASVQSCYGSEAANPPPPPTLDELLGDFRHVFIGEVVSREVAEAETRYTFNVTEWLLNPLNTSRVVWTEDGGSIIMVSPSKTLYVGIEYLVYFDDYNGIQIGIDRHFRLLNGIDDDDMSDFRYHIAALKAVTLHAEIASDFSSEKKMIVDLRPHTLLVSWVLLMLILKKLLKK